MILRFKWRVRSPESRSHSEQDGLVQFIEPNTSQHLLSCHLSLSESHNCKYKSRSKYKYKSKNKYKSKYKQGWEESLDGARARMRLGSTCRLLSLLLPAELTTRWPAPAESKGFPHLARPDQLGSERGPGGLVTLAIIWKGGQISLGLTIVTWLTSWLSGNCC